MRDLGKGRGYLSNGVNVAEGKGAWERKRGGMIDLEGTYTDTLKRDTGIRDTVELDMLMRNRDIWRLRVVGRLMATK